MVLHSSCCLANEQRYKEMCNVHAMIQWAITTTTYYPVLPGILGGARVMFRTLLCGVVMKGVLHVGQLVGGEVEDIA